jgi:hypothetical protein
MIHVRDNGIIGAFMLYLEDKDIEGFKARTVHKVTSESREGAPGAALSSATTAGFQGTNPGTAVGAQRRRANPADRYLPVIMDLEVKSLLDEQTSSVLKTLILEENVDIFRVINSYLSFVINEKELSFKLTRLA